MTKNTIEAGAYMILNAEYRSVLHVNHLNQDHSLVSLEGRDEHRQRDSQVWWVEPLPFQEGHGQYTITNIRSGKALQARLPNTLSDLAANFTTAKLTTAEYTGFGWQSWNIRRVQDSAKDMDDGWINYSITRASPVGDITSPVGDILEASSSENLQLKNSSTKSFDRAQRWEFIIPVLGIPAGWALVQNRSTGLLLGHNYLSQPPVAVASTSTPFLAQYRETWGVQWSFLPCTDERGFWMIKNRLTDGILQHRSSMPRHSHLQVLAGKENIFYYSLWQPELDDDGNILIRSGERNQVLGANGDGWELGTELSCGKRNSEGCPHQEWRILPVLEYAKARQARGLSSHATTIDTKPALASYENDNSETSGTGTQTPATSSEYTVSRSSMIKWKCEDCEKPAISLGSYLVPGRSLDPRIGGITLESIMAPKCGLHRGFETSDFKEF